MNFLLNIMKTFRNQKKICIDGTVTKDIEKSYVWEFQNIKKAPKGALIITYFKSKSVITVSQGLIIQIVVL